MKKLPAHFKWAVYCEESEDPPAGCCSLYYSAYGEKWECLLWPVGEIVGHIEDALDEDELKELDSLPHWKRATEKHIRHFNWDNGGIGGRLEFLVEGKDIVPCALAFLEDELGEDPDDYDEEDCDEDNAAAIIETARANPTSLDAVLALLSYIDERIDAHNESQY